jgi:hypothetical protein
MYMMVYLSGLIADDLLWLSKDLLAANVATDNLKVML